MWSAGLAAPAAPALALGLVLTLALGACAGPRSSGGSSATGDPADLRWRPSDDVVCDGTERLAGSVEEAEPGEAIGYTSPMPVEVPAGQADARGQHQLWWSCQPEEAHLRWDLTATGADSGRRATFTVRGAAVSSEPGPVAVDLYDDGVVCDGTRQTVGVLSGLEPGERVSFESERSGVSAEPRADDRGVVEIGWRCRPGDVDQRWSVTAVAPGSDRSTSFRLSGLAATDDRPLALERAVDEVVCDGQVHILATLVNLFPFEIVTFSAPGAEGLIDGRATGDGRLDLRWDCGRADAGSTWELTARATETGKTIALRFTGVAGPPPEPAEVLLVESPFVCDGERRPVAELTALAPGEFVDFASPQAEALREGRFEGDPLVVHWQCRPDEVGQDATMVWEVTATGRQSGRAVTFEVVGVRPGDGR